MNEPPLRALRIVILAAGFSSRLGQAKALARVHSQSLLARTLRQVQGLAAAATLVIIPANAGRYRIVTRGLKVAWVINRNRSEGLSSSVRRGILASRYAAAVLFLPVDLVNLKRRDIELMIKRWRSAPRRVVARELAGAGAIPLILPKRLFRDAMRVTGDRGLRALIAAMPRQEIALLTVASAAMDVDTRRALAEARRQLRRAN